jgi:hypothetical protein
MLSGHIPSNISHLMFLDTVNLSNNLLSGEISSGSQLQTLNDPSIYSNNLGLCGPPLSTACTNNSSIATPVDGAKEHHQDLWLYYSIIAGVVFGFWVWFGIVCLQDLEDYFLQLHRCTAPKVYAKDEEYLIVQQSALHLEFLEASSDLHCLQW